MSEKQPSPEQPERVVIPFEYNGVKYELTPENSGVFLHDEEPQFDHIFFTQGDGFLYVFRRAVANFDNVVEYMNDKGFEITPEVYATPQDKEWYFKTYGYPEIPKRELTPREERKLAFARYLLEAERITPDSFRDKL